MPPAITVENLSKAYRIGVKEEIPDTLTGALTNLARAPFKNFGKLKNLSTIQDNELGDDVLWALRDVSFEIEEGEVVGIIGRNGAGKSTLLKILSRITEPTSGRATIRGRVSSLLEVGTGFHPELTGRENVYMNGTILGMTKREIDRKFDEIVDFSGVEKFLDTPSKRYSSGMQVRLAFAVAAHLEPEILIIDEVLAVGDAEFQKKCLGKMQDVAEGGRTVLFVSHNMAAVESLCRRAIEIRRGQCAYDGTPATTISHYRHEAFEAASVSMPALLASSNYIENAVLVDENQDPTNYVTLGGKFCLRLTLQTSKQLSNPKIGVGIDSITGQRMLTLHTPASHNSLSGLCENAHVYCNIEQFPLAPGEYSLKIAISEGGQQLEAIDGIVPFTVADGEIFGEGRGFHQGTCIAPSQWNHQPIFTSIS